MNVSKTQQLNIDASYLSCSRLPLASGCKKSLSEPSHNTECLSVHVCADISCHLCDCFCYENDESIFSYPQKTTLLVFGLSAHSQFTFLNEQQQCTIRKGDVWLLNTDGVDLLRSTSANINSRIFVVEYSTERLINTFNTTDEIGLSFNCTQMIRLDHEELSESWISTLLNNPMLTASDRVLVQANAMALIARWLSPDNESRFSAMSPLKKVINLLTHDLVYTPSLELLAQGAGMTYSRLNRKFAEHYGVSVFVWLRNYRIERACQYLKDKSRSITDIAFQCGFSNVSHFAGSFKKQLGLLPAEYRLSDKSYTYTS